MNMLSKKGIVTGPGTKSDDSSNCELTYTMCTTIMFKARGKMGATSGSGSLRAALAPRPGPCQPEWAHWASDR